MGIWMKLEYSAYTATRRRRIGSVEPAGRQTKTTPKLDRHENLHGQRSERQVGRVGRCAIKGEPTVIVRRGKLVVLQAYELPDHSDEFDALIQAGKDSPHRTLTRKVLDDIWKRGRARGRR